MLALTVRKKRYNHQPQCSATRYELMAVFIRRKLVYGVHKDRPGMLVPALPGVQLNPCCFDSF